MSPILGIIASANQGQYISYGSYDSIATQTIGAGGSTSVSFTSIPSTYKHLQIRAIFQPGVAGEQLALRFNSDSGSNYTFHQIGGDGSSAFAGAGTSLTSVRTAVIINSTPSNNPNCFGAGVVDILDYTNTNKYTTVRSIGGGDVNGGGGVLVLRSNLWSNTAAITSIECRVSDGSSMSQYTRIALYGIKG